MSKSQEHVILVNQEDEPIGLMEKLEAHEKGLLHRAFSVFLFNSSGELLIQQRAFNKYHSPGLWTNTCCSHPREGESPVEAAKRRLEEEMGMSCELVPAFSFTYKHEFENGLIEHEFDHVFIGSTECLPQPNPDEVANFRYVSKNELEKEIKHSKETFTPWFILCYQRVFDYIS